MEITVNGELHKVPEGSNIVQLLEAMDQVGQRLAVEVNLEIIPRSLHEQYVLKENDRVEIVHAIGGG
ncbi:MAG: sulfur carrier protein ThiS [Gammaproteobacteria bacterium]|nr:sulfur carrier protein ThiS [Gammaproteobacteria bacterium]